MLIILIDDVGFGTCERLRAYDGGGLAKGGAVTLYLDGKEVGVGRIERTEPFPFSGDERLDLALAFH